MNRQSEIYGRKRKKYIEKSSLCSIVILYHYNPAVFHKYLFNDIDIRIDSCQKKYSDLQLSGF